MTLAYDAPVPYDTPDYTYDGILVVAVILEINARVSDVLSLSARLHD